MTAQGWAVLAGAILAPLLSYLLAAKRMSGKIGTTTADELWAESRDIRADYRRQVQDCRDENAKVRNDLAEARNEAAGLRNELADARFEIAGLKKQIADLLEHGGSLR